MAQSPIVNEENRTYIYGEKEQLVNVHQDFKFLFYYYYSIYRYSYFYLFWKKNRFIQKDLYNQFVDLMPIVCIDIITEDTKTNKILLIQRDQEPLKGVMFFPGGRMLRGETFFESAKRKLKEETNLTSEPKRVLGVVNTFFEKCEWKTRAGTQTVNILVHVEVDNIQELKLNDLHTKYEWIEIQEQDKFDRYIKDGLNLLSKAKNSH